MSLHCIFAFANEQLSPIARVLRCAAFPLDRHVPEQLQRLAEQIGTRR